MFSMLSALTIKGTAVIKPERMAAMAMIVCERVGGNIAFLFVSDELSLAWQLACPEPG